MVKFEIVAFVANKFVEVEFVDVTLVKIPVEATVFPIGTPLIVPPEIVAFDEMNVGAVSVEIFAESALKFVPEAVANPNEEVDVPFAKERFAMVPLVIVPFVSVPFVANKFVDVVFVPVALVHVRFAKDDGEEPVIESEFTERLVPVAFVKVRFVMFALVPVAFVQANVGKEVLEALESVCHTPAT
jgi:hypothetical protein